MTRFTFTILGKFHDQTYKQLLHEHQIIESTPKYIEFLNDSRPPIKGYHVRKDARKFIIDQGMKDSMPLKVRQEPQEEITKSKKDVVYVIEPNTVSSFRIIPEPLLTFKELVDMDQIKHSNPDDWTLWKILLLVARCSRVNFCFSTNPAWGKSGMCDVYNYLFDLMPSLNAPRTQAALVRGLSPTGVLILDEFAGKELLSQDLVPKILEQIAAGKNYITFGTAGSYEYGTRNPPPCTWLSTVILYNLFGTQEEVHRKEASYCTKDDFFDWGIMNKAALNSRYIKFKPDDGELDVSQFYTGSQELTNEDQELFRKAAKTLKHYEIEFKDGCTNELTKEQLDFCQEIVANQSTVKEGRHKGTLSELAKGIMLYHQGDTDAFSLTFSRLLSWHENYKKMLLKANKEPKNTIGAYDNEIL